MSITDIEMLFRFVGGLGMFLYGMHIMADGLQKSAGGKMKQLLGVLTSHRILGPCRCTCDGRYSEFICDNGHGRRIC